MTLENKRKKFNMENELIISSKGDNKTGNKRQV